MKIRIRLNKTTLAAMPAPVRDVVVAWRERYGRTFIGFERASKFYIQEDARFTAFGPDLRSMTVRAGGEWAGVTNLMPGRHCPLPAGCTVVETGFFCGVPYLSIFHNPESVREIAAFTGELACAQLAVA